MQIVCPSLRRNFCQKNHGVTPSAIMPCRDGPKECHCSARTARAKFQNSLLCGLSGWVESQVEFPTFNERKKTVGFSFEELIRRKWRNLPSKKSPAYNASLG